MIKYEVRRLTNGYPQFCADFDTMQEAHEEVERLRATSRDVFIISPALIPEHGAAAQLPKVFARAAGASR
jgi:hypothetical protein